MPDDGENRGVGELPEGTITMLFSDIEGSTALLHRLGGERYGEALSAQRALIRAAITAWRGHEMGTEGDSFYVVFQSAADAVCCCLAAQQALGGQDWPGEALVRVRMGLHSGEPTRHEDGYIGMDVHRAARIAATAHGGQVVLSEPTRLLAAGQMPAGASVRDLGLHRLKDIEAPERIYQLGGPGLAPDRDQQARELNSLGIARRHTGDTDGARSLLEQAVALNREIGGAHLAGALANLAQLESATGRFDRAFEALQEALVLDRQQGDLFGVAVDQHSLALVSLRSGRPAEARGTLCGVIDFAMASGNTSLLVNVLELAAAIIAELGEAPRAGRLAGAAAANRDESGMLISAQEAAMLEEFLAPARAAMTPQEWDAELAAGRALSQAEALALLRPDTAVDPACDPGDP